ncbi:hypothetical protein [uncultured Rhodoblastus sp.]|uniref:hypothetical protein n=1 Tax=uncultured Rhodoblastus sp. TaxID=543037 RepID=UPI0025D501A7|nr:hypothetical protein [uncultured Rhodoblastus sp.]
MRLIYRSSGKPVAIGDRVLLRDGEVEVTGFEKPHKPSAAGRVILRNDLGTSSPFTSPRSVPNGSSAKTPAGNREKPYELSGIHKPAGLSDRPMG